MNRKHMPLMIGGGVVLVLLLALLYLLFNFKGSYSETVGKLDRAEISLKRLSQRPVFPSEKNVEVLKEQLGVYEDYQNALFQEMCKGQFKAAKVSRAQFPLVLEGVIRRLVKKAREDSVTLPPSPSFGFQRYAEGNLPAEEDVSRLSMQLRSIAALVNILYESGINELTSVERTVFEKDAQIAAPVENRIVRRHGARGQPEETEQQASTEVFTDPDGLFTKEHYVLAYRAQDDANWAILNRMAKGTPFIVVTKMEVINSARPAVALPKSEEPEAPPRQAVSQSGWKSASPAGGPVDVTPEAEILPRELRVVAGQEMPNVRLEVDLYRFAEAADGNTAEGGEVIP